MIDVVVSLKAARRVSTPIVAISTTDQTALTHRILESINGDSPKFTWDLLRGLQATSPQADVVLKKMGETAIAGTVNNPVGMLKLLVSKTGSSNAFPERSLVIMLNAHKFTEQPGFIQGVHNMRDEFCQDHRTLVLLGSTFNLGRDLADVVTFDEALPSDEQIGAIVDELYTSHVERSPEPVVRAAAVDAARGLSAFIAEQVLAMSLSKKDGLDLESTWERKKTEVNRTKGLRFVRGGPKFSDLGGLDAFKEYITRAFNGPKRPGCVVFFDELEKAIAGAGSDSSGVSDDALQTLLTWMENGGHTGMLAVGMPGTGKTAGGMAIGATFDVPTVVVDLGGMRGRHVGDSEQALREALKVIDSIAGERGAYVYATCNKEVSLPGALKRRFKDGEWYFALPTEEERENIWKIHQKTHGLEEMPRPNDEQWTGAEIRNCCEGAWRLGRTLEQAAQYVVPVVVSSSESLHELERQATNRWLSASYPGPYRGADPEAFGTMEHASHPRSKRGIKMDG